MNKLAFPSYASYKQIEADYLDSLHPRRQAKALVSQSMFDRIWDVLHNQDRTENPQFRFWARKKFTLGTLTNPNIKPDSSIIGPGVASPPQSVLLHQGSIVAVQEQIYDILCFSHAAADHGGRDKTCAAVREHYTWVPKELVSKFVKACPTCISKKRKMSKSKDTMKSVITRRKTFPALREYLSDLVNHVSSNSGRDRDDATSVLYTFDGTSVSMSALNHAGSKSNASELSGGPISDDGSSSTTPSINNTLDQHPIPSGSTPVPFELIDATPVLHRETNQSAPARLIARQIAPVSIDNGLNRQANLSAPTRPVTNRHPCGGLKSLPMSREVSLFQGLPNGWQFHHSDYAAAREDFVVNKREDDVQGNKSAPPSQLSARSCGGGGCGGAGRPRVPSLAPMIPGDFADEEPGVAPVPPLYAAKENDMTPKPRATGTLDKVGFFQATEITGSCGRDKSKEEVVSIPVCAKKKPTSSIMRAAAVPLSLDLPSQTTVGSCSAHRSAFGELSPDSPVESSVCPVGSVGSSASRQVSPCDERDETLGEVLADSTGAMKLGINPEAVREVEGLNVGAVV